MTRSEMERLGWDELDILLVTGDAYVDHPAFGAALLGRLLCEDGYRVGVVAQPRWDSPDDIKQMGRPRLFVGVTAGALDSMLAHYTAFRKKRSDDAYTPGGEAGARPNRASIVYANLVRQAFPGVPVVLGGIEASMRRVSHYDFWTDKVRRSILVDAKADLVVYGMGERAVREIARRLREAPDEPKAALHGIPGTVYVGEPQGEPVWQIPSHEAILADPKLLMDATLTLERQVQNGSAWVTQEADGRTVVAAPPAAPLEGPELDALYTLPFTRRAHPSYRDPVPAVEMIQFSITTHRGCASGCTFCSLAAHQGRRIRSRSGQSIVAEARAMTERREWRGSISDVGGPTANMWGARCTGDPAACTRVSCLHPKICRFFATEQAALAGLLRAVERVPGVKHLRTASGVRHDLAMMEPQYVRTLVGEFVGGQLKLAPEHCTTGVLRLMRKPDFESFEKFLTVFEHESKRVGKQQYVVPYLMSAFPGCKDDDMRQLMNWLMGKRWRPQQVQCFIPTPGTVATAMYHGRIDPNGNSIP
ncbi:YgiQ family radical SAM protein, partial [bacterium]|nr:YgiQ family radical SAM protein [bacterium]